jgi:DNA-binding MarR family transcriptional regulator
VAEQPSRAGLLAELAAEAPRQGASAVRLNIAIAHQLAMPLADVQCMGLLADGPSAPGDLAARLGLTSGAMTKVLDRLERAGYVTRAADPADRRRITIAADPGGLARLAAHYAPMGEKMSRYLDQLSTADLAAVLAFMRAGREAADEEIGRIRRQGILHATRRPRRRQP